MSPYYEDSYYDFAANIELRKYYQKLTDGMYKVREAKRKTRSMFEGLIFTIDLIKVRPKQRLTLLAVENLMGLHKALKKLLK